MTPAGNAMRAWTEDELGRAGGAEELQLASQRPDGSLRPYVTMWVVRVGGELYVRSAHGPVSPWYRRATASGVGRVRAGGVERDFAFAAADPGVHAAIDAACRSKYDHYGPRTVGAVVGPDARPVTLRLVPRNNPEDIADGHQCGLTAHDPLKDIPGA